MTLSLAKSYNGKTDVYERARPLYPSAAITWINHCVPRLSTLPIVDIGAGTGILTRQLGALGLPMIGIEPNRQMLTQARDRDQNADYRQGSAEDTGLAPGSARAIVCGQSFHWFDTRRAAEEFRRILNVGGPVILAWNIRSPDHDAFHIAYEAMLAQSFEHYAQTLEIDRELEDRVNDFYAGQFEERRFANAQQLGIDEFIDRTLSCSYAALPGTAEYEAAIAALQALHRQFQVQGQVSLRYSTRVVHGVI
ncbi:class I SAM-dependent methyltransferase [Pseudomonas parafulva]|uniref:class I SAM-dependent methyltransferase n=1 Tax=Pseudomonas parafulva TaxID=157782 RepID=UPI000541356A|nr:class I SAM-dependent methyltransferase [Pseudomonas parafulva]AIZ34258.1 hypothetical protein NJ69_15290 [Pseudomonas parafulva]